LAESSHDASASAPSKKIVYISIRMIDSRLPRKDFLATPIIAARKRLRDYKPPHRLEQNRIPSGLHQVSQLTRKQAWAGAGAPVYSRKHLRENMSQVKLGANLLALTEQTLVSACSVGLARAANTRVCAQAHKNTRRLQRGLAGRFSRYALCLASICKVAQKLERVVNVWVLVLTVC